MTLKSLLSDFRCADDDPQEAPGTGFRPMAGKKFADRP